MTSDSSVLSRFGALDSATVSDALESLGLSPGQGGLRPMWGRPKLVGFAATVELEPIAADATQGGAHILTSAIAEAGPADVMVIANKGRTDVSCWGGLVSLGASVRGIRGVIADGACRDVDDARNLEFPVYARASIPVTGRGRLHQVSAGEPVALGAVTVHQGDVVLADETGVVVVPRQRVEAVLEAATALVAREEAIASEVRAGASLPQAMLDSRLAGTLESVDADRG